MATKLKNLRIKKVDFVDEGANPDAHIRMIKRKEGEEQAAEEGSGKEPGGVLKKLFGFIGKAAGMDQGEIDSAMAEIEKGSSMSFTERINAVNIGKIADEIRDACYALQSSFCSILNDEEMDSTGSEKAMRESLGEFCAFVEESIPKWSNGRVTGIVRKSEQVSALDVELMKSAVGRLNETIEKACKDIPREKPQEAGSGNNEKPEGGKEKMKIDKSKLTDAERAFLESIEKRYSTEDGDGSVSSSVTASTPASTEQASAPAEQIVTKSAQEKTGETPAEQTGSEEDIYKGLHPAVKAELEGLKKFREEAEDRELAAVAKRYAIIGKTEEELVPMFKSLRAAGGTAYHDMIAVLDQAVETVEKSGAFSEIGKSGYGGSADGGAWAEAEVKAVELMKSRSGLSKAQALDEVLTANPELAARCEKED